jgi:cyclophilin family peptidyl-prolyl cis-trans isomerase
MEQFRKDNPQDVRFVYRHFPLSHDKSDITTQAAEAAALQGKFWEMHDILFNPADWQTWAQMTPEDFQKWVTTKAEEAGLDIAQFTTDLTSDAVKKKVEESRTAAQTAGINATPSAFILMDGKLIFAVNVDQNDAIGLTRENLDTILSMWKLEKNQFKECPPMAIDLAKQYTATITTTKGDITVDLFAKQAPLTVNSFAFLAQQKWFDNVDFHRVIEGFVAQAGDPTGSGLGGPGYEFGDEISPDLKFEGPGVVGMANSGSGTNGSQFFITLAAQPSLDGKYTVFGKVTSGMDVVNQLTKRDPSAGGTRPQADKILSVTIAEK